MIWGPVDKWASLDYGKTAHWWVGAEGTACGLDFRADIRRARDEAPHCLRCIKAMIERNREAS